jgi:ribosomal protein S12 methylthiotransferase accessory factor
MFIKERETLLPNAEAIIDNYFIKNKIRVELSQYGSPFSSTVVKLHLEDGSTCIGCGKGTEDEARIGAKFEAYEHLVDLSGVRANSSIIPFERLTAQPYFFDFAPIDMIRKSQPKRIAAIQFNEELGKKTALLYPQFLIDYRYASNQNENDDSDYRQARRYSCGTGLAVGVGFHEAAVHALSEVIERHAVGLFLANTFFYCNQSAIKTIARNSISESLAKVLAEAEKQIGSRITMIDVTSNIQVTVVAAHCQGKTISGVHVIGAGCSLYPEHAAMRAIKELIQQYMIADGVDFVRQEWARHYAHLMKYPKLLRCLIADLSHIKQKEVELPTISPPTDLSNHLTRLFTECDRVNMHAWVKELRKEEGGITLACAVMPKMERFSSVSLGNYVVPTFAKDLIEHEA